MGNENGVLIALVAIGIIVNLVFGMLLFNSSSKDVEVDASKIQVPEVKLSDADLANIASQVKVDVPASSNESPVSAVAVEDKDSDSFKEKLAVKLTLEVVEDKDFKKLLVELLNDNNASIEDYKDIESIVVKDSEADVSGSDADVELELRVYFFNDGDTDADAKESARVNVDLSVSGLKASKDFIDAEVEDYELSDFSFVKFYD